ncbi:hypothetical protein Thiowin_00975 [Thiorhodovibrio winogradskyi]|uniref:Transposase n=1 Tax=Thiorhodovibrio winogradskyi TaxID=77007 RepID=A0ABZ0S691_9GAMM
MKQPLRTSISERLPMQLERKDSLFAKRLQQWKSEYRRRTMAAGLPLPWPASALIGLGQLPNLWRMVQACEQQFALLLQFARQVVAKAR